MSHCYQDTFPHKHCSDALLGLFTEGCLGLDRDESMVRLVRALHLLSIALLFADFFFFFFYWCCARGLGTAGRVNSPHSRCLRHLPRPWCGSAVCACPQRSSPACRPAQWGPSASAGHPADCPGWPRVGCCWAEVCCHLWRGEEDWMVSVPKGSLAY